MKVSDAGGCENTWFGKAGVGVVVGIVRSCNFRYYIYNSFATRSIWHHVMRLIFIRMREKSFYSENFLAAALQNPPPLQNSAKNDCLKLGFIVLFSIVYTVVQKSQNPDQNNAWKTHYFWLDMSIPKMNFLRV